MGCRTYIRDLVEQVRDGLRRGESLEERGLARELRRKLDASRRKLPSGTFVADEYRIYLNPDDLVGLDPLLRRLKADLKAQLERRIAEKKYALLAPKLSLAFEPFEELRRGEVLIEVGYRDEEADAAPPERERPRVRLRTRPSSTAASGGRRTGGEGTVLEEGDDSETRVVEQMVGELQVLGGPEKGRIVPIAAGEVVVGRGRDADVVLVDPTHALSRAHFRIAARPGEVRIADLDSANGLRVNGERVRTAVLVQGDTIKAGGVRLAFRAARG